MFLPFFLSARIPRNVIQDGHDDRGRDRVQLARRLPRRHVGEGAVPGGQHLPGVRADDLPLRRGCRQGPHAPRRQHPGVLGPRLHGKPGA